MQYIKQLDALRAIAVLLVIIGHWFHKTHIFLRILPSSGVIGVTFFYVLSGFLITSILLATKENDSDKASVLKNFYIRRTLRIFPLYYFTLLIIYLFFTDKVEQEEGGNLIYFLLYGTNILVYIKQSWVGSFSHLWSLAVEEQFYLIWPWVIVFTNKRHILNIIIASIIIGISTYFILPYVLPFPNRVGVLTPTCFDSFGMGGLLAYFTMWRRDKLPTFRKYVNIIALLALIPFVLTLYFKLRLGISLRTIVSVLSISLLAFAIENRRNIFHKFILHNPFLILLGKFSYGLYLLHIFVPLIYGESKILKTRFFKNIISPSFTGEILFMEHFIALVIISWFSWKFFETPINNLKRFYNYKAKPVPKEVLLDFTKLPK